LKGYDYSRKGFYFITKCVQHQEHRFGHVENGRMILNDAGQMIEKWYYRLESKFPDIRCVVHVVMPNHFHCIIENTGIRSPVGANPPVRPDDTDMGDLGTNPSVGANPTARPDDTDMGDLGTNQSVRANPPVGANPRVRPDDIDMDEFGDFGDTGEHVGIGEEGEHMGSPLRHIMQWFGTMTTNEYIRGVKNHGWPRFDKKLWQRNYWERIVRDPAAYNRISNYIRNNPKNWDLDPLK
jgi:REP element-mobilizing transposase RayT